MLKSLRLNELNPHGEHPVFNTNLVYPALHAHVDAVTRNESAGSNMHFAPDKKFPALHAHSARRSDDTNITKSVKPLFFFILKMREKESLGNGRT
jgi:hypothetical protein